MLDIQLHCPHWHEWSTMPVKIKPSCTIQIKTNNISLLKTKSQLANSLSRQDYVIAPKGISMGSIVYLLRSYAVQLRVEGRDQLNVQGNLNTT